MKKYVITLAFLNPTVNLGRNGTIIANALATFIVIEASQPFQKL